MEVKLCQKITRINDGLNVPNEPIIPFIIGDGIGPDIWKARVALLMHVEKAYNGENVLNGKKY